MNLSPYDLMLYAGGMALLWAVPGPVWVALIARSLTGGFASAWPLAVGVVIGDVLWPFCAIFGLAWVLSLYGDFLVVLRWVAAGIFALMGLMLILRPAAALSPDSRLTRPGRWAGFFTGVAAVIGNPKAILFYMGVLPGFFDLSAVKGPDVAAILLISGLVPLIGNLGLALFVDRARRLVSSPENLHRMHVGAGALLIGVALAILLL